MTAHTKDDSQRLRTVQNKLRARRDSHTIGYGERYPAECPPHLRFDDSNNATGVGHVDPDKEVAFDITSFGSGHPGAKSFLDVLRHRGVPVAPVGDYYRLYRDMGRGFETDYPPRWLHAWSSPRLSIICSNNPITGEAHTQQTAASFGDAGMMGIAGDGDAVHTTSVLVKQSGRTKGNNIERGRMFI